MSPGDILNKNERTEIYYYAKIIADTNKKTDIETYMTPDSTALRLLKNNKHRAE